MGVSAFLRSPRDRLNDKLSVSGPQKLKQDREYEAKLAKALRKTSELEKTHARLEEDLREEREQLAKVEVRVIAHGMWRPPPNSHSLDMCNSALLGVLSRTNALTIVFQFCVCLPGARRACVDAAAETGSTAAPGTSEGHCACARKPAEQMSYLRKGCSNPLSGRTYQRVSSRIGAVHC
jgi:hypothetical protein